MQCNGLNIIKLMLRFNDKNLDILSVIIVIVLLGTIRNCVSCNKGDRPTSCKIDTHIQNCSPYKESRPKFTRYRYVFFVGSFYMKNCDLTNHVLDEVYMNWEIWKVEDPEIKVKDIMKKTKLVIESESLDYGIYKLKLITNVFFQDGGMQKTMTECYFEEAGTGMQTIIYGGYLRTVNFQSDIYFEVITMIAPGRHVPPETTQVRYHWSCEPKEWFCDTFSTTDTQRLIKGPLVTNSSQYNDSNIILTYKFQLSIVVGVLLSNGITRYKVHTEEQKVSITEIPGVNIGIICLLNCGGKAFKTNSQDILHLEVKFNKTIETVTKPVWFYKTGEGNDTEVPMEARCKDTWTDASELRIKRDFLKEDTEYLFSATSKHGGKTLQRAEIKVFTSPIPPDVMCTVNRRRRDKGIIHYHDVICSYKNEDSELVSVIYEWYNRDSEIENGRHLGISKTGILENVLLTRPKLYVCVTNFFGASSESQININMINITEFSSEAEVQKEIDLVYGFHGNFLYNYCYRINLISAYCDLLSYSNSTSSKFKFEKFDSMLEKLYFDRAQTVSGVVMLHSVVIRIMNIVNSTEPKRLLKSESIDYIANLLKRVSLAINVVITNPKKASSLTTTQRIYSIAKEILQCSNFILEIKEHYNLEDLHKRYNLRKSSYSVTGALKITLSSLEFQQSYAINELSVKFKNIWLRSVRWIQGEKLLTRVHTGDGNILKFAPVPKLHLNIINYDLNPFWWSNGYKINTQVKVVYLPISLSNEITNSFLKEQFNFELKIRNFDYLLISSSVKQPNPHSGPDINDIIIAVHRIKAEVNSLSFINFTYIQNCTSLRVVILQGRRPDFDDMNDSNHSNVVTVRSHVLEFLMRNVKQDTFFYIGVLPGKNVTVDKKVSYNFTIFSAACRIWRYDMWTATDQCSTTMRPGEDVLYCTCPLGSETVAGYVHIPSHNLNPFSDFPLFISHKDYPIIVAVVITIVIIYYLLLFWTRRRDQKDEQELMVSVLEDNDPRDSAAYLVGVFTGARLGAGTTSNVGIRLFGDLGYSRSHILNSLHRPHLKTNSDNWFLLFTPHHLGSLTNILLWTDHTGWHPNWYCSKIVVFDLLHYENDFFFIESWFGITEHGINLKTFKECATCSETNKISRIISENLFYGFLEAHYWVSVFFKHPRSPVTRSQRLSVTVSGLLVNILVCIFLYFPTTLESADLYSFMVTKDTIIIGMIGSLSGSLVSFAIMNYLYSCYKATDVPIGFCTNKACCDIYHLKRKITLMEHDPMWLQFLRKITKRHVSPIMAFPLQNVNHLIIGIQINKRKLKVLLYLQIVIMIICCHFIIAISLQYGENKMLLLFLSIIFSIVQINLLIAPIRILLTAVFLGCAKARYYELITFSIGVGNVLKTLKRKYNSNFKRFLIRLRNLDMYKVPSELKIKKLTQSNQHYTLALGIYYTVGCITFIFVLIWLIQLFKIKMFFLMNIQTFCNKFGNQELCQTVYRRDLTNIMEFWDNLFDDIFPAVYSTKWYNGQNKSLPQEIFHKTGWFVSSASRLIGVPRLRQIRANPHISTAQCQVPRVMKNITAKCQIPTTWLNEETDDDNNYGVGWSNNTWFPGGLFSSSPWEYTEPREGGRYLRGPSGRKYHSGGYIAMLHRDLIKTKASLSSLFDTNWVDSNSRVIIVDFTMYNAYNDVFTQTNIVTEFFTTGRVKVIFYFNSVVFTTHKKAGVLFLLMVLVFGIQFVCLMNITGTWNFFKVIWNLFDFLILLLFVSTVAEYCIWVMRVSKGTERLSKQGKDVYFSLDDMTVFSEHVRDTVGIMFSLLLFRLLRVIRFDEDIRVYVRDILEARTEIFFAVLITGMFMFVQFRFIMFLTVPPAAHRFKDVLIFRSQFKNVLRHTYRRSSTGKILSYILNFTSQLGIFTFMLSQHHHFKKAQVIRVQKLRRREKFAENLLGYS